MTTSPPPATPAFVCFASFAERVLAYGHAQDDDSAHAWCKRARTVFLDHADQVVIACPIEVDWLGAGRSLTLGFVAGWVRTGFSWQTAEPALVRLSFDELPAGPTPVELLKEPPTPPRGRVAGENAAHELGSVSRLLGHLSRATRSLASTAASLSRAPAKVLLVKADAYERRRLRHALATDVDMTEAESFSDALIALASWDFDAVITDHDMRALGTGVDLLGETRDRWPRVRRVLCAGSIAEVELALAAGVAHHILRKPLEREALLATLTT